MAIPQSSIAAYCFGAFRLSVRNRLLERDGVRVPLTPKMVDTLFVLVERAGQLVPKEELMQAVWPDVTVVESGLTRNISMLRKTLEDGQPAESVIETIPRRGYRFVAELTIERDSPANQDSLQEHASIQSASQPASETLQKSEVVHSRRANWWILSSVLCVLLAAGYWAFTYGRRNSPSAVDPNVRVGEHLLNKLAPAETARAVEYFERAVAANPNSAEAQAGLAVALVQWSALGGTPIDTVLPKAQQSAQRAFELNGDSHLAHYAMGGIRMFKDWDLAGADAHFQRALDLRPDLVTYRFGYSYLKLNRGDLIKARSLVEEALRLDPASPLMGTQYCRVFYTAREFRRAEAECRKVLDRESGYALAHYYLALSLGFLGQFEEAAKELQKSKLNPELLETDQAWLSLMAGDLRPATRRLEHLRRLVSQGKVDPAARVLLASSLGKVDEAFESLEQGIQVHSLDLLGFSSDPRLDPLRQDPRYQAIAARIGTVRR